MTEREMLNTFHRLKFITKYGFTFFAAMLTLHCGLLYLGYDAIVIHLVAVLFAWLVCLHLSHLFNLCWVHKLTVTYVGGVLLCMVFRRYDIFEDHLTLWRGIMCGLGAFQIILTIVWSRIRKNC